MMYLLKLLLYCFCLTTLNVRALKADGSFEDADQVNEFITMSFSSSHPYDLRQTIPGEPEIDYPIYSAVPKTNFDCNGRHEGYYADIQARCQVFRICANTDLVGKGFAFLCPNGTLFSQKNFVCDWYRNVDCSDSERYYSKNDNNRIGTRSDMMKTVRQMMEHPMKTISIALNRGKPTTLQPTTSRISFATRPTKTSSNFKINTPQDISRLPLEDNFNLENLPINLNQDDAGSGFSSPLPETPTTPPTNILTPPLRGGFKPVNAATLNITPPSPTFSPPFETPLSPPPYEFPLSSDNISYDTYSSATQAGFPLSPTEDSSSEKDVYVSSLGELSTDPGANFNRQTSRVIADLPSNALDPETKPTNGMNFAQKVNSGLNGLQVVNQDEVIAPEYVKNIMQSNVGLPEQPPASFDFASNINSLLDEVNYEAELEGRNSAVQFQQLQARLQKEPIPITKKPFRFLSRGFSHEKSKDGGSYVYGPTTSSRSRHRTAQHSASTQSYNNSLITTLLTTTQSPVTSTETTQSLTLENASEILNIESTVELNTKSKDPSFELNESSTLLDDKKESSIIETSQPDKLSDSQVVNKPEPELEPKLDSKPAIKREPKELKQLDSIDSVKELSPELDDQGKVNVNKRAEDLLLAGVKQITVNEPDEKNKATEEDVSVPIVPIYNRASAPQTSTPHITSSSTTSTISTTTTSSSLLTTTVSSSTSDISSTTLSTTTEASSTTFEPTTTPAVSIRRFTVGSGQQRRLTSRPISYSRKNNSNRSASRTTTTKSTTTTGPSYRGRLGARSTSTTSAPPNTTKITISPRRRLNVNRYTYGSRRRTTEPSSSTSSSTTTTATPPNKKLNVRSSDSALSDLTAVASTYNAVSNRAYNSIRQNSIKYTQTKRRRPNHTNVTSETTTTMKPSIKNSNAQQSRSPSLSHPTPTLAPFSHHEAISPIPTSSTTPETLPATFLSFNDLTKSITDDSILQTLRKNQASTKQLVDSSAFRSQQQALPKQQISFSTVPRIQQDHSTPRPTISEATILPFIPLKDFIASKFGAQYSPEPPKLSISRPALSTQSFNNDYLSKTQKKPIYDQQYSKQQYSGARQEFAPQTNQAIKLSTPGQYTVRNQLNQNVFQQQSQQNAQQQTQQQQLEQLQQQQQQQLQQQLQQQQLHQQQQQKQQYQEQQLRLQQQQQKLQQLKQQQNHLQQQYQLQQQQQKLQQQKLQQHQVPTQQYFSNNQQQKMYPAQQYSQIQQTIPTQTIQQQQRMPIQHRNSMHQVSAKIVPSIEQQFQIQRSQQIQPPQQQQRQESQIQIIPSQMTISQTIPPNNQNINFSSNVKSEIGSINVRLPSNLAGLIPNTNIFELSRNSNSLESAQRRSDQQTFEDAYGARERKSAYAGVSSYDVPLSSVGRLTNDVTNFLRQRRL